MKKPPSKAAIARARYQRSMKAALKQAPNTAAEDMDTLLTQAVQTANATLSRPIGPPTKADRVKVYGFDDSSILVVPEEGDAYIPKNRYDRKHFLNVLTAQNHTQEAAAAA